jgi:hypothetical protein
LPHFLVGQICVPLRWYTREPVGYLVVPQTNAWLVGCLINLCLVGVFRAQRTIHKF